MSLNHILLVNDDGINAPGLIPLGKELAKKGYKISIIAPNKEQSCKSHSLTFFENIEYFEHEHEGIDVYSITGTPCDCVKFGILNLLDNYPDLIISGINNVMNVGNDIYYSGTISAAIEGSINGIKSIAVSLDEFGDGFEDTIKFIVNNVEMLYSKINNHETILNINIPYGDFKKIKGVEYTCVGKKYYNDEYVKNGNGYILKGHVKYYQHNPKNSDVEVTNDGYISISPIKVSYTDHEVLEVLNNDNDKFSLILIG